VLSLHLDSSKNIDLYHPRCISIAPLQTSHVVVMDLPPHLQPKAMLYQPWAPNKMITTRDTQDGSSNPRCCSTRPQEPHLIKGDNAGENIGAGHGRTPLQARAGKANRGAIVPATSREGTYIAGWGEKE
jgi:hypothetical protein